MTRQTEEQRLVAQYLANGGKVTQCPPRTFALEAYAPMTWKERSNAEFQAAMNARRTGIAIAKAAESIPVGQVSRLFSVRFTNAQLIEAWKLPTVREVADALQVGERQVRRRAKELGLVRAKPEKALKLPKPVKPAKVKAVREPRLAGVRGKVSLVPLQRIVRLIETGMSIRQTAEAVGLGHTAIETRIKRAGLSVTKIVQDYHLRTYGDTSRMRPVHARQGFKEIPPCVIGEYQWATRQEAADALYVHVQNLKNWMKPDASEASKAKLARAVAEWARRSERVAA